jgi:DNA-directed RNA polymerase specialized sigma24 family protein
MTAALVLVLRRAEARLVARLGELEARLDAGEDRWAEYLTAAVALAQLEPATGAGARGRLLSTRELAEAMGISTRTIRRHKAAGRLAPAAQLGRTARWRA